MALDVARTHLEDGEQIPRNTISVDHSEVKYESSDACHQSEKPLMLKPEPVQQCSTDVKALTDDTSFATSTANITKRDKKRKNDQPLNQQYKMPFKTAFEKLRRSMGLAQKPQYSIKSEAKSPLNLSTNPYSTLPSVYDQSKSHPTSRAKLLLHETLDVPQRYRLRQKKGPNDTKYLFPEEMRWCDNTSTLCSPTSEGHHRRNCKVSSLEKRYFTLDDSGQICQYAMAPDAEETYQITADSVVLASDAVDGQPCSLRLFHHNIDNTGVQERPVTEYHIPARSRRVLNTFTTHMIILFREPEVFAVWMLAIHQCVQRCKAGQDRTISTSLFELPAQLL